MEKLRVPDELKMSKLLENYPADDIAGFHKDKVYFICDSIYRGMQKLGEDMVHPDKKDQYFVPLHSEILRKVFGGNCYKGILLWMECAGIIIPDGKWEAKRVSQGYKFVDYFLDCHTTWITVTCSTLLSKEVRNYIEKKLHFQPAVAKRLEKWFDKDRLQIDAPKAHELNDALEAAEKASTHNEKKIRQAHITAIANQNKIDNIVSGNYLFEQDEFGYRLHTVISQLPKEFRSLISYDGMPMVEIDLSCSQLFFSTFLLDYRHWKFKNSKPFHKELWNKVSIIDNKNNNNLNTIMYINSLESSYGKGFQQHTFFKTSCEGLIYDTVVAKLDEQNFFAENFDFAQKRKRVKKVLLQQLFANQFDKEHGGLFCNKNRPILEAFTALYPEVVYIYSQIKEGHYKDLCKLLQRIESIAMQHFVCKRLQADHPNVPIFTLHDCIVTTQGNEQLVRQVMEDGIRQYVGYVPEMKIKPWSSFEVKLNEALPMQQAA